MPRPKLNPGEILALELRITPPDGKPIEDWKVDDTNFKMVLAAREGGGDTGVRLHYHLYIETLRSRSWILNWVYSIAHCYNGEKGNSVVFTGKPHDKTIGYVVKHGDIACRHGCSDGFITEWLNKSDEYVRNVAAKRKADVRRNQAFSALVRQKVAATLASDASMRTPTCICNLVLAEYHKAEKVYPSRTQVECLIATLLHPYDEGLVRLFYTKSFDRQYI